MIEQLLLGDHIIPAQAEQHISGAVKADSMLRREQEDQHVVEHHEHRRKAQHKAHIPQADPGKGKQPHAHKRQEDQKTGVVGAHGRKAPQQQTDQLGGPGEPVDGRGPVDIVEQISHRSASRS